MDKKGYGANHTLLWLPRETLSVKLSFQLRSRRPKNTYTSVKEQFYRDKCVSLYIIHNSSEKSTVFSKKYPELQWAAMGNSVFLLQMGIRIFC